MSAHDNHCGPLYDEVRAAFPEATRFHWSEQMFGESFWLVGAPVECGGGSGVFWKSVPLTALSAAQAGAEHFMDKAYAAGNL